MVFVKVRETYDLKTVKDKMTVIGIHTPNPDIIKKNYPGLLLQCRAYRPVSCDVRLACASVLPLDPLGVGTEAGDVAPEDVFNPILYKAMSNKGMSQLEARINAMSANGLVETDISGNTSEVKVDGFTSLNDEFPVYYGLLSNTHDWKHANVQSGLSMSNLKPLVYEVYQNIGDGDGSAPGQSYTYPGSAGSVNQANVPVAYGRVVGDAHPMPFINCTAYSTNSSTAGFSDMGFNQALDYLYNCSTTVPWIRAYVGAIIVPPSRLHSLYFRMVCEWTIEFSKLRPVGEITDWVGLSATGNATHYQNYSYEETKKAVTGDSESILGGDSCMVSANVNVDKVM